MQENSIFEILNDVEQVDFMVVGNTEYLNCVMFGEFVRIVHEIGTEVYSCQFGDNYIEKITHQELEAWVKSFMGAQ